MTASEMLALAVRLEAIERPAAHDRMLAPLQQGAIPAQANWPERDDQGKHGPQSRDIVGPAVGLTGRTYARLRVVGDAIDDESLPEPVREAARQALADLDAGKRPSVGLSVSAADGGRR